MSKMNYGRPRYRVSGKETEAIDGSDLPLPATSRRWKQPPRKTDLRKEAEEAVRNFDPSKVKKVEAIGANRMANPPKPFSSHRAVRTMQQLAKPPWE